MPLREIPKPRYASLCTPPKPREVPRPKNIWNNFYMCFGTEPVCSDAACTKCHNIQTFLKLTVQIPKN